MALSILRTSIIVSAIIFTAIGMCLSIAALLSPSWQVVNLQEYNSVHEHGLWLDCIRHIRDVTGVLLRRYLTETEPLHCVYKFDYDKYSGTFDLEDDNSPVGEVNRHKFYGWHTATLILIIIGLITSFASICFGSCSCSIPSLTLIFTSIILLTTFISSVAEGLFFFFSHRADNRFIKGIVGTYEQRVGLAFFLQMGACLFHFIAFIISMFATFIAFSSKNSQLNRAQSSSLYSSKNNINGIGRSTTTLNPLDQSRPLLRIAPPPPPHPISLNSQPGSSSLAIQNFDYLGNEETPQESISFNSNQPPQLPPIPSHNNFKNLKTIQQQQKYLFPTTKSSSLRHESSTEFDHQLFTQEDEQLNNNQPKPKIRSQYYSRQNEKFERIIDSMPELTGRISLKSETCV